MGVDSSVAITAGSGTTIDTFVPSGGDHQQVVRVAWATAVGSTNNWSISTTASTSQIAADINRVGLIITNNGAARVYLRFDSTAPTSSIFHWYLEPGDRWEVPDSLARLAVSMLGTTASGNVLSLLATAA